MNKKTKTYSVILALLAAVFYAINTPFSKVLLNNVAPTIMAAFLYLGAGFGVGITYLFHIKQNYVIIVKNKSKVSSLFNVSNI